MSSRDKDCWILTSRIRPTTVQDGETHSREAQHVMPKRRSPQALACSMQARNTQAHNMWPATRRQAHSARPRMHDAWSIMRSRVRPHARRVVHARSTHSAHAMRGENHGHVSWSIDVLSWSMVLFCMIGWLRHAQMLDLS